MATLTPPLAGRLLRLPDYQITGVELVVDPPSGDPHNKFLIGSRVWEQRLLTATNAATGELPACWTIHQAALQGGHGSIAAYVASGDVWADPPRRWGAAGTLVRPPRAIITDLLSVEQEGGDLLNPIAIALLDMTAELEAAGIFAGGVKCLTLGNLICRACLPHEGITTINDASIDWEGLLVNEEKTVGGAVMFIFTDEECISTISVGGRLPYVLQPGTELNALKAHDVSLLNRAAPQFGAVQYLWLESDISGSSSDDDLAWSQLLSVQAAAPTGVVELFRYGESICKDNVLGSEATHLQAIQDVQDTVRAFFGL